MIDPTAARMQTRMDALGVPAALEIAKAQDKYASMVKRLPPFDLIGLCDAVLDEMHRRAARPVGLGNR